MVILITGATGFIGEHLSAALRARGHTVLAASRNARGPSSVRADFMRDTTPESWTPRLQGVDVVINAVGILRETANQSFDCIHARGPQALFRACALAGVQRVIQISALGATTGTTRYFRSKRAADEHLAASSLDWTIVQPSLVYGDTGTSARMFTFMASLPIIPVPGDGRQRVQPIHVEDLIAAVVRLCEERRAVRQTIALVGPHALSFREFLLTLRSAMRIRRTFVLPIPLPLMRIAATIGERLPRALLDRDTLVMLQAGNTHDPAATIDLLEREPKTVESFIPTESRTAVVTTARLRWLLPLLRISIALVWIWTGIVSFGLYPREQSLALLYRTGVPESIAPLMLYGAAALDFLFGIATLVLPRRRWLWLAQIGLIVLYTIIITFRLPEFWLHPYGPILKNLPMLAALYLLYTLEDSPWNMSS